VEGHGIDGVQVDTLNDICDKCQLHAIHKRDVYTKRTYFTVIWPVGSESPESWPSTTAKWHVSEVDDE